MANIVYNRQTECRKNLTELRLYDENFNLIKKIDKINKQNNLSIKAITIDKENELIYSYYHSK